ncbi:hypothetical protein [Megasphaera sp.]|uniref:hypothetical protein n=1 Tax=Megasphaera sp. TaxID=2023260 RepID=UPI0025C0FAE2|nr:hypothetical protein [Megasphaera sp.]MCF0154110.1 hypothetical protein [Megasphaera sp.]MCF0257940.1 hypothetical protein [Bacteroides heparinolyticus]
MDQTKRIIVGIALAVSWALASFCGYYFANRQFQAAKPQITPEERILTMKDKNDFTISQYLYWNHNVFAGLDKEVEFKSDQKCVITLRSPETKSTQGAIYLQKVDEDAKQTVWQMTNLISEGPGKPEHPNTLFYAKK